MLAINALWVDLVNQYGSQGVDFEDTNAPGVAADSWTKESINYVSALGIMSGVGNIKFDPNGFYTCEQTILTVLRLYNLITE